MSSLATQLAHNASLNSSVLVDRTRRKPTVSYLFTGKEADQHDFHTIHAIGVNALLQLSSIDISFGRFENSLFSEHARGTDRTLLTPERNAELDEELKELLLKLGPYLLEAPTGRVLEWLVRRFRVHEFNLESIIALFLPYHETPHFTKMVTLLQIKESSTWKFLLPYKSAAQNLPRVSLVTEMLKNSEVARFVTSLLPQALKNGSIHTTLVNFNAATLHEFVKRSRTLDDGTMAYLLSALLEPLRAHLKGNIPDAVVGSYILLASLSQKVKFSYDALKVVFKSMVFSSPNVRDDQFMKSLVAVCWPQECLTKLPGKTLELIIQKENIEEQLSAALNWVGSEKVLVPLVKSCSTRLSDPGIAPVLESLISNPMSEKVVMGPMIDSLIHVAIGSESQPENSRLAHRLLSLVQQRYPSISESIAQTLMRTEQASSEAIKQLMISLSLTSQVGSQTKDFRGFDAVLASSSPEDSIRVMAVKDLVQSISTGNIFGTENEDAIRNSLTARLQDDDVNVVEALYENPPTITAVFLDDIDAYLKSLELAVASKPKRNILRLHLNHLGTHIWPKLETSIRDTVFHRIVFPFLLFTKAKQKTTDVVWNIISDKLFEGPQSSLSVWLKGCSPMCISKMMEGDGVVDAMAQTNINISQKIAENIASCDQPELHIGVLTTKFADTNPLVVLLALQISSALINLLVGHRQLEVATKILQMLDIREIQGVEDVAQCADLTALDSLELAKSVVSKPQSKATMKWLIVSIIASIAQIPKPPNLTLNWFHKGALDISGSGQAYTFLIQRVYKIINASTTLPMLTTLLLQSLFINLRDEALAFLAGVWSTNDSGSEAPLQRVALLHGAAFLEAHVLEKDGLDFQLILPSLLVALQHTDQNIRQRAMECISRVRILTEDQLSSIYRFDAIYGSNSGTLQYLDRDDLKRYMGALVINSDHFVNDASYIKVFHHEYLNRSKADKKRDAEFKHRTTCFLLSHISVCSAQHTQSKLLQSLTTVTEEAKVLLLNPMIHTMVKQAASVPPSEIFNGCSEEFTEIALSCFDSVSAGYLNNNDEVWKVFLNMLHTYLRSGVALPVQLKISHSLQTGLFSSLNSNRKLAVCEALLELGAQDASNPIPRSILQKILKEVSLMVKMLNMLTPSTDNATSHVAKRAKTTGISEDPLPHLVLLAEALGTQSLPPSLELVTHLLNTLNKVLRPAPSSQTDPNYLQQLLMSAIDSSASKITDVSNISPSVIRLEVLVELIRVSGNPQTFQQALLLMANLARLAPESVLFNVMPVFTFMGTNVFQGDDSYNFKVVQQTIDGIVPVMVASLKESHNDPLDLYIGSREFLRVFTDAAHHIPSHRRNNFFVHLVGVLGQRDFLPPICMLLVDKISRTVRNVRQSTEEIQNSLSLPISVFQQADFETQKYAISEILTEVQRLVARIVYPAGASPTFIEDTLEGDHSVTSSTLLRRRSKAFLTFVGYALKKDKAQREPMGDAHPMSTIMERLIALSTLEGDVASDNKLSAISAAARSTTSRLLLSMSVSDFMNSVEAMLQSQDVKIQSGAMELLAKRLHDVSLTTRETISSTIINVIKLIQSVFSVHKRGTVVDFALQAIKSISETMCSGEEGSLTEVMPNIMSAIQDPDSLRSSFPVLPVISVKLGPRIIPFFRQIVSQTIIVLRGTESSLYESGFAVLTGLLSTIPTFWGSGELSQLVYLYMDSNNNPALSVPATKLIKTTAKKVPAKMFLPTLLEMWAQMKTEKNMPRIAAFFEVMTRSLQHAERATVLEFLRSTFTVFVEGLDLIAVDEQVESRTVSAFRELVVKLNDAAFKPLFRRLFDWAFVGDHATDARKVTFMHLFSSLLDFFKGLLVPYTSFLLQPFNEILTSYARLKSTEFALWSGVIQSLTRSLNFDDGAFWRDDKLRDLSKCLTGQIPICAASSTAPEFANEGKTLLQDCLGAFVENATDDTLLKTVNLDILMHTRAEDPRLVIFALNCSEALWRAHGHKLLGFVPETATFLTECSEDGNDLVVKESFRLKDAVESIAGNVDGL